MSKLLWEDEDYIIVEAYLHSNKDSYDDWELVPKETDLSAPWKGFVERYSTEFHETWHYALYEVEFILQVDKKTGKYVILQVQDGDQILEV